MRFRVDASLPGAVAPTLMALGHDALDVRAIGLAAAADRQIAELAKAQNRCILTRDFDFADIREYPPADYFGVVVFAAPEGASRSIVMAMVERAMSDEELLAILTGRLVVVEPARVRIRPAP